MCTGLLNSTKANWTEKFKPSFPPRQDAQTQKNYLLACLCFTIPYSLLLEMVLERPLVKDHSDNWEFHIFSLQSPKTLSHGVFCCFVCGFVCLFVCFCLRNKLKKTLQNKKKSCRFCPSFFIQVLTVTISGSWSESWSECRKTVVSTKW